MSVVRDGNLQRLGRGIQRVWTSTLSLDTQSEGTCLRVKGS